MESEYKTFQSTGMAVRALVVMAVLFVLCCHGVAGAQAPTPEAKQDVFRRLQIILKQAPANHTYLDAGGWECRPEALPIAPSTTMQELIDKVQAASALGTRDAIEAKDAALAEAGISIEQFQRVRSEYGEVAGAANLVAFVNQFQLSQGESAASGSEKLFELLWDPSMKDFETARKHLYFLEVVAARFDVPAVQEVSRIQFGGDPPKLYYAPISDMYVAVRTGDKKALHSQVNREEFEYLESTYSIRVTNAGPLKDGVQQVYYDLVEDTPAELAARADAAAVEAKESDQFATYCQSFERWQALAEEHNWSYVDGDGWDCSPAKAVAMTAESPEDTLSEIQDVCALLNELHPASPIYSECEKKLSKLCMSVGFDMQKVTEIREKLGPIAAGAHVWRYIDGAFSQAGVSTPEPLQVHDLVELLLERGKQPIDGSQMDVLDKVFVAAGKASGLKDISGVITRHEGETPELFLKVRVATSEVYSLAESLGAVTPQSVAVISTETDPSQKDVTVAVYRFHPTGV